MPASQPDPSVTPVTTHPARNIRRTVLPNGLLVLTESMPHLRSVSMGAWINSGSRDEPAEENGLSHFVEHMVFKGTTTRSAQDIAREVDSIGGNLDAFTGKESVCFNIKVLDENMHTALDVLSDLVLHPKFSEADLEREQGVILEEIKMDEDNPDYLVHETFTQNFWKNHPLGRPILGTVKTVSSFSQDTVFAHHARRFTPENMVFSAAGHLHHDEFLALVESKFGNLKAAGIPIVETETQPVTTPHITLKKKRSLEQVQMCLGMPAPARQLARPLRDLPAQLDAGRRHELAALRVYPRERGPGLQHLLRAFAVPRRRRALHLRRYVAGQERARP